MRRTRGPLIQSFRVLERALSRFLHRECYAVSAQVHYSTSRLGILADTKESYLLTEALEREITNGLSCNIEYILQSMSARLLFLALSATLLAACPGGATHVTDATRGFITQRGSERHDPFMGAEPVDINTLAAAVITAARATQAASRSYPMQGCGVTSGRALCLRTSRGGATQQVSSSFGVSVLASEDLRQRELFSCMPVS